MCKRHGSEGVMKHRVCAGGGVGVTVGQEALGGTKLTRKVVLKCCYSPLQP